MNIRSVDGVRIACEIDGPGNPAARTPTIVFSNSLGTNLDMWEPQLAPLRARVRVVRYDSRGHGQSEVPPGPYSIELLGWDLLALLDALELQAVYLCGLSLGGMAALWTAAHHPERVQGAVFANTAARIGTDAVWNERISAVNSGGMAAVRDGVVARFLSSGFRAQRPEVARAIGDMVEATPAQGYAAACAAVRDADLHPILPRIRARSLIICSAWDQSTPAAQGKELHAAIRGSQYVELQAAHLSNVEQSEQFTESVMKFIAQEDVAP